MMISFSLSPNGHVLFNCLLLHVRYFLLVFERLLYTGLRWGPMGLFVLLERLSGFHLRNLSLHEAED